MRAILLTVVLLPLLALGQRSCSASQNQRVTGLPADVPTFAASASVCCSLCAALSNCVAANFNASASLCERFANVTSTTPSTGSTVLQATGAPIPAPAEPHRRWIAETDTEEDPLQVNWAGINGGFVTVNGCERISLATGQHINNTCNATKFNQMNFQSSYTLDNHYVISNFFDVGVALVYPSPGWWLNLLDGSLLASQPVSFAAVDGLPPLAVALMNVNYFAVLTAFNLLNGSVVWRSASEYNFHQHVTYSVGKSGSTVLVAGGDSSGSAAATLFAFDSQTGIPLWTVKESTFLPAGYGTMVGGYIAANDKYAVTTLTSVGSSGSSFSLAIAEVATGAQQCTNYSFGTGDWVLIPGTLDVANKFLLWSTRSGNGAGVVEVLVFSIGVCRVVRRFIVEEVDGNTVQMFYDVQTRTVVAWAGNQVVAYRRDSDEQRWAYWFNPINTVTVGDGVVILSIGLGTEIIALDL